MIEQETMLKEFEEYCEEVGMAQNETIRNKRKDKVTTLYVFLRNVGIDNKALNEITTLHGVYGKY